MGFVMGYVVWALSVGEILTGSECLVDTRCGGSMCEDIRGEVQLTDWVDGRLFGCSSWMWVGLWAAVYGFLASSMTLLVSVLFLFSGLVMGRCYGGCWGFCLGICVRVVGTL